MRKIKIFSIVSFCVLMLVGCMSGKRQIEEITSKVYIGMSLEDFNKVVKRKTLVAMKDGVTVYKVKRQVWYDSDGSGADVRFFYFYEGKLTSVDEGERKVDRRIQIDNR
ncbi:hypothetical protein [Flavobacterium sp. Root186]|uniref:hypothetical protein n=1 Tax=Flavobacterium sp. Root186 TaxID=1736485 RepID=UPI0006F4A721|nr:hypothetical protein [Flavobacterium sp. Root186]KRB54702.1 hypothetical protein ASD98_16815 [Flavobacterium sp. Root186]